MLQARYIEFIERLAAESGTQKEEIDKRIKQKQASLSGLVTLEGASLIIAKELGINFDKRKVKLSELLTGMRDIEFIGKIMKIYPVRSYMQGRDRSIEGKIGSMFVADETGSVRVVLWDMKHVSMLEKQELSEGDIIHIKAADVRGADFKELHLTNKSSLEKSNEKIETIKITPSYHLHPKKISDLQEGDRASVRAFVVQIFSPNFFATCPDCNTRAAPSEDKFLCKTHGEVVPKWKPFLSMFVDDGFGNIRAIAFGDAVTKILGLDEEKILEFKNNLEGFEAIKDDILGKEFFLDGKTQNNAFYKRIEFVVNNVHDVNLEELIKEMQK